MHGGVCTAAHEVAGEQRWSKMNKHERRRTNLSRKGEKNKAKGSNGRRVAWWERLFWAWWGGRGGVLGSRQCVIVRVWKSEKKERNGINLAESEWSLFHKNKPMSKAFNNQHLSQSPDTATVLLPFCPWQSLTGLSDFSLCFLIVRVLPFVCVCPHVKLPTAIQCVWNFTP